MSHSQSNKLLVISNYGSYHTVRPEAEVFIGLQKLGWDITVMTPEEGEYPAIFRENGIKTIPLVFTKKFDSKATNIIKAELEKHPYKALFLFNGKAIINGIKAAKNNPVKVIAYRGYEGNIKFYDPSAYVKFLHPRVDYIWCNSIGVEQYFHQNPFFKKNKTIVVNKGHRTEWYEETRSADLGTLGIPKDALTVVLVANDRKMKGVEYFIKTANYIPKEANIHFILIGGGLDKPAYKAIAAKGLNSEKIHFTGYRTDALQLVKAADIFALSSLFGESITKSVIEAMSLKTAPVITDIPGNVELLVEGKNGFIVPKANPKAMAEAILKLDKDRILLQQFKEQSYERINTFLNASKTIEKWDNLLKEKI